VPRYSVSSSGRRTASVGIPRTGLGYTTSRGGGRRHSSASAPTRSRRQASSAPPTIPKPGLFALKREKEFGKALEDY
jgi:hypothetical protein